MTPTPDLAATIARLEELDARATKGPWAWGAFRKPYTTDEEYALNVALRNEALPALRAAGERIEAAERSAVAKSEQYVAERKRADALEAELDEARKVEREACAKIADEEVNRYAAEVAANEGGGSGYADGWQHSAEEIAAAIRSRGDHIPAAPVPEGE